MTGLERKNIIGRKGTEVFPGIEKGDFDWIGVMGKVAQGGGSINFEKYSEPLKLWYDVQAYSDEPGYFTTVFTEITARKRETVSMKELLKLTESLLNTDRAGINYQEIAETLQQLSGAKFTAINTYEEDRTKTITRAITGIPDLIDKLLKRWALALPASPGILFPSVCVKLKAANWSVSAVSMKQQWVR